MFDNIKISLKLPLAVVGFLLIAGVALVTQGYMSAKSSMTTVASEKLSAIKAARVSQLDSYLSSIDEDLGLMATNVNTVNALRDFSAAWNEMGSAVEGNLQDLYINDNRYPNGEKDKLYDAGDDSSYTDAHIKYHPWFHELQQKRGYYDVFLLDINGNLVYSVFKELDYATNLTNGRWRRTDLGSAFRAAIDSSVDGQQFFYDFKPYAPSNDAPASFLAQAVKDSAGNVIGAAIFQMPIARINNIMQEAEGMGESGESYIVGSDYLMRSDSRFSTESTILKTKVTGETVSAALKRKDGVKILEDYRGIPVVSAYGTVEFHGTVWAVLAEVDVAEMEEPIVAMGLDMMWIALLISTILAGLAYLFSNTITKPIVKIVGAMSVLADGDQTVDIPYTARGDEIGNMASTLGVFKENLIARDQQRKELAEAEERQRGEEEAARERDAQEERDKLEKERQEMEAREAKAKALTTLIQKFDGDVAELLSLVSSAATELESTATSMSAIAEQTDRQSITVAGAAEEATANVQTVASASEELGASIQEISRQMQLSSVANREAADKTEATSGIMIELETASQSISEVVNLINDIAEQTNLLALNATIEAARAGDAGRGFAVVASEVKSLATQTAKATDQISEQIQAVQGKSNDAAKAMSDIKNSVDSTNELASAVAAAVEEQQAATGEISRNVQDAATGTQEVSQNIQGVSEGASQTKEASAQVLETSQDVAKSTTGLKDTIDAFLRDVREIS